MPPPGFRKPAPPGPQGLAHPSQIEATSVFRDWPTPAFTDPPVETLCATVYFKTNESDVSGVDDLTTLGTVGQILTYLQAGAHLFTCRCVGHADVRASEGHNLTLSDMRASRVKQELDKCLPRPPAGTEWVKKEGLGERGSRNASQHWPEDRRVDIFVRREPTRLRRVALGFEVASDADIEWVFSLDFQKYELNQKCSPAAWHRDEISAVYRELLAKPEGQALRTRNLTFTDYMREVRSKVTAYVFVRHEFVAQRNRHRITADVFDAVSDAPLFPPESVEAEVLLDTNDTSYTPNTDREQRVWRKLQQGQQAPAGAIVETRTGAPVGLTALRQELYRKLCFVHPTITHRVAQKLGVPAASP